jgi:hypothetical protein
MTRSLTAIAMLSVVTACGGAGAPDAGPDGAPDGDADAGPPICLHDACEEGAILDARCSECARAVCAEEEWCCLVRWDEGCIELALGHPDVCTCAPEDGCGDLIDDDRDDRFDCDDPDCALACTPGDGALGDPCASSADCAATGDDPFCADAARFEWPNGFCTELCTIDPDDCPEGGECQDIGLPDGRGICQRLCDPSDPSACRDGYECREDRGQGPYCQPRFEDCANGDDDDLDGRVDCEEFDCLYADGCGEDCANGIDDNADGRTDCDDVRCVDAVACSARAVAVCADPLPPRSSCVAVGEPGFPCDPVTSEGCLPGQTCEMVGGGFLCFGHPNDIAPCERCGGLRGRCAPGTHCMILASARCAPFCCDDDDCGAGAICNHAYVASFISRVESPVGVCVEGEP